MANDQTSETLEGAARVGSDLRGVRERLGWKLSDVAAGLRIRAPYLEAIERGELSALPGAAYQTGFIRSYAQTLGLDPDEILHRFRAAGMGASPKAELSFLAPVPDRAVPTGAIVLLGVVILLLGYGVWYRHTAQERHLAAAVPAIPAELAPLAVPKAAAPLARPAAPKPALPAAQAAATPSVLAPSALTTPAPPATAPGVASPAGVLPAGALTAGALTAGQSILATADTWIEVKDPAGNILFSRVLHAGQSWPVPDIPGLTMTAGNAGATEITAAGKAGAPLGAAGAVVHNYQLTPAATKPPAPAGTP